MEKEKIIKRLDGAAEFSLCAMVFALPFSKSLVEIFFVLALVFWAGKRIVAASRKSRVTGSKLISLKEKIRACLRAFTPVKTESNLPIAVFLSLGIFSALNSVSFFLSAEGLFFKLFEWILIYFIAAETFDTREKLNTVFRVMVLSMALAAIDGVFQFITGSDFIRGHLIEGHRIKGPFSSVNTFSGWLTAMLPLALGIALRKKAKIVKSSGWILSALVVFCLLATFSRGALIAAALSVCVFGIFVNKRLAIATVVIVLISAYFVPRLAKERAFSAANTAAVNRAALWKEGLSIIEDFPILGSGLNTYAVVAPRYKAFEEGGTYPHNSYIHMAAESGIPALASFMWILAALFASSTAIIKRTRDDFYGVFLAALTAGLFGLLAHSFVDTNIYTLQLGNLMWFIMGLMAAVRRTADPPEGEPAHSLTR